MVLSDTVRQRRSRTPSSSTAPTTPAHTITTQVTIEVTPPPSKSPVPESTPNLQPNNVLPDLLPKTFHLAESSSLFSKISEGETVPTTTSPFHNGHPKKRDQNSENLRQQAFSVVEIRESNLSIPTRPSINRVGSSDTEHFLVPKVGEVVNTINILELADYFEPECVETVNILDITSETSDTETCSTPIMDDRVIRITTSEEGIDEMEELLVDDSPVLLRRSPDKIMVEKTRTSFDENKRKFFQDRDILHDSETKESKDGAKTNVIRKKLTPSLKEILSGMDSDGQLSTNDTVFMNLNRNYFLNFFSCLFCHVFLQEVCLFSPKVDLELFISVFNFN